MKPKERFHRSWGSAQKEVREWGVVAFHTQSQGHGSLACLTVTVEGESLAGFSWAGLNSSQRAPVTFPPALLVPSHTAILLLSWERVTNLGRRILSSPALLSLVFCVEFNQFIWNW